MIYSKGNFCLSDYMSLRCRTCVSTCSCVGTRIRVRRRLGDSSRSVPRAEVRLVLKPSHPFDVPALLSCLPPSASPLLPSRRHEGDWLRPHQDVHEAPEHRGQAAAVFEVRSVFPQISDSLAEGQPSAGSSAVWHRRRKPPCPALVSCPNPHNPAIIIAHHCSLGERAFVGHLLCARPWSGLRGYSGPPTAWGPAFMEPAPASGSPHTPERPQHWAGAVLCCPAPGLQPADPPGGRRSLIDPPHGQPPVCLTSLRSG